MSWIFSYLNIFVLHLQIFEKLYISLEMSKLFINLIPSGCLHLKLPNELNASIIWLIYALQFNIKIIAVLIQVQVRSVCANVHGAKMKMQLHFIIQGRETLDGTKSWLVFLHFPSIKIVLALIKFFNFQNKFEKLHSLANIY